jgi:integrase/recombinase XerD
MAAAADYIEWMRNKRSASPNTLSNYSRIVGLWERFIPTDVAERTPEDVEAFTARPRRGGTCAPATVANEVAILTSFYRWGQARLAWPMNPATLAGRPKVNNRQPRPVDDDTWVKLWRADLPTDARVALGLAYYCGLRRAEVVALHGEQVWGRALVNFTRKGGGEDRFDYGDVLDHTAAFLPALLPDPDVLERPLRDLAQQRSGRPLMPWLSTSPKAMNKRMPSWLRLAEVTEQVTPHMLRHSFATNLMRSGVPLDVACDLCNHSSPAITMRYIKTGGGRLAALRTTTLHQASN